MTGPAHLAHLAHVPADRGSGRRRPVWSRRLVVRVTLLFGLILVATPATATCCPEDGPSIQLCIATGQQGGVYFAYGTGLAKVLTDHLPGARSQALVTGASLDNLRLLAAQQADIAFTLSDSAAAAAWGTAPFEAPQPVRAIARLYDNYLRADLDIRSLADLRGKNVSVGAAGSGTEFLVDRLLGVAGLDPGHDLTVRREELESSAQALRRRTIDGFFFSGGLPTESIVRLASERVMKLVDLRAYVAPMASRYGDFYSERTIPASTYALPETGTVGASDYLVVRQDMKNDVAFALTSLLFSKREELANAHPEARRLNPSLAYSTYPLELHPGAVRYYRRLRP